MAITDPLVLPASVLLIPVEELPLPVRQSLDAVEGDVAITRRQSRTPSKIIDTESAALVREFQTPRTIAQAVFRYSRERSLQPEQALEEAFPMLQNLLGSGLLVLADTEQESGGPALAVGDIVNEWVVAACVQSLEDTEVYQVNRAGVTAALKIARPGSGHEPRRMLDREAAILEKLDSVSSPHLLGRGEYENRPYLLIEWCPGADAAAIAGRCRREGDHSGLLALCGNILGAYVRLHERGIIHGDVHPRNVLLSETGKAIIIDYGLARRDDYHEPLFRGGVGFFFEPEYARAAISGQPPPVPTFLGEQYSLAALLYQLLTGGQYLAFSLETGEMLRQIAEDTPLPFTHWDAVPWPEVERLLSRALQKDPAARFSALAEMAEAWAQISSDVDATTAHSQSNALMTLSDRLLTRLGQDGPLLTSRLAAPAASLNYGAAGIAYALYRLACAREDAALLALADIWSAKACRDAEEDTAFYNKALDLTPETVGRVSPYHTLAGVQAVRALIGQAFGDPVAYGKGCDAFLAASRQSCDCLDLTLGRAGMLLACLFLHEAAPQGVADTNPLLSFGNKVFLDLWSRIDSFAPVPECREVNYLGMAHGWAGLLYVTLLWCRFMGRELPPNMEERLSQLAACAQRTGRGLYWLWQNRLGDVRAGGGTMPGWCNGSAGYVHLWTLAHRTFKDSRYLSLAEGAAWNCWETFSRVANLCCGLAGQSYALLNLYQLTNGSEWLGRARLLAERAAQMAASSANDINFEQLALRSESLYKGEVGIMVLREDLHRPQEASQPFFGPEGGFTL